MNYIGLFIYINTCTSKFSEICVALYIAEACTRETVLTQICVVFIYFCQLPELWSRSSALGCATYIVKHMEISGRVANLVLSADELQNISSFGANTSQF